MTTIKLLFGMKDRISRSTYLIWGILLMILKYIGEMACYYFAKGDLLTPFNFLSPLLYLRYPKFFTLPDWFALMIIIWSLPFIWIGVGMSIRRAADSGLSPWLGILFFIPGINYLLMMILVLVPTSSTSVWEPQNRREHSSKFMSSLALTVVFALAGTFLTWFNTNFLKTYATSFFVGSPLILGIVQGYLLNLKKPQKFGKTLSFVMLTILCIHLLLLLFALEGIICLAMSLPISACLGFIGAILGAGISRYAKLSSFSPAVMVLALPFMPWVESHAIKAHQDLVLSTIEINVAPEQVWQNVVKFSDLPPAQEWLFKLGVAHPIRARIDGQGVGAVRHCEFSTGAFVEPITVWNKPNQLAFDVKYQPQSMKEVSFYDHVDAPHLHGYFRSIRGEFRLIPLSGGRTRLEGRTWYEMDIQPGWYWQIYGRWFIHKIHLRVLSHIKHLSEIKSNI